MPTNKSDLQCISNKAPSLAFNVPSLIDLIRALAIKDFIFYVAFILRSESAWKTRTPHEAASGYRQSRGHEQAEEPGSDYLRA
jgi:hypothetical protein